LPIFDPTAQPWLLACILVSLRASLRAEFAAIMARWRDANQVSMCHSQR
jgi:hypothetical protein